MYLNYTATSNKSDKSYCTMCDDNRHKMETILFECKTNECNLNGKCCVRYKVTHCLERGTYKFYQLNQHAPNWKCDNVKLSDKKGLTPKVKRLVNYLYFQYES